MPFSAPGDRLRVRVVERRARYARGEIAGIEHAGPARREPRCGVFGACGGCSWQHLEYEAQLEAKRAILVDAIERIGRLSPPGVVAIQGSPVEYGYRTRARVIAAAGRVGFRRAQSHELEPIDHCPVLVSEVDHTLADAARIGAAHDRPVEVELACGAGGAARAVLGGSDVGDTIELEVGSARLRVSAGVFAQANGPLLESLSEAVLEASGSARRAVELYAGAGLFTLGLAQRFEQLLAVEANARATADLTFNLERAGQGARVEVLTQPVARSLARVAAFEPDVVVLDPPRSGLDRGCAERLGAVAARRIVYVSCDPATLARDLRGLCRTGYSLRQLRAFDLFPQTHHVEAVAVLEHG